MKIAIFGMGHVGCINAVGLRGLGHDVVGIDIDQNKIKLLRSGHWPVFEKRLKERVIEGEHLNVGSLSFFSYIDKWDWDFDLIFICVGTPSSSSGQVDLSQLKEVCQVIGQGFSCNKKHHIVVRSTVPPGTSEKIIIPLLESVSGQKYKDGFDYSFFPEFLREGEGFYDFDQPSLFVVGSKSLACVEMLKKCFSWQGVVQPVEIRVAEMIKYVNNSFHALKVVFANEVGVLAKSCDVDAQKLMEIFIQDKILNISEKYLRPGVPYGGSCLSKDVRAMNLLAESQALELPLISSLESSNEKHIDRFVHLINNISVDRWLLTGISFKPGTSDLRESSIVRVIEKISTDCQRKIVVLEEIETIDKNREVLINGRVQWVNEIEGDIEEYSGVLLGSKKMSKEEIALLCDFTGYIVDFGFHELPLKVKNNPGYRTIC